ncbi:MAG: winged helix DNA-binding protein [Alphaproteobacteria bacterium]
MAKKTDDETLSPFNYLHKTSHLSRTRFEANFSDFEFALHHIHEAFRRWSVELNASITGESLPLQDVSVLQVLRMRDRPKSGSEIAQALNRDDTANVAYTLKKLERLGLVERAAGTPQSQTVYAVTEEGRRATDYYAVLRRELLLSLLPEEPGFEETLEKATKLLITLTGLYDHAARRTGMYRPTDAGLDRVPGDGAPIEAEAPAES